MEVHKQLNKMSRDGKQPGLPEIGKEELGKIEQILGYQFKDKDLLVVALTHPSYYCPYEAVGFLYKRLEFMGDAALSWLVTRWIFSKYPDLSPGPLTLLRSANVDTEKLARVAVCSNLHLHLRHKASLLNDQIKEFAEGIEEYPVHSFGLLDPPKVFADTVESLLGAIFLDSESSLKTVWKVFKRIAEPLICLENLRKHPVTELKELCQKNKLKLKYNTDTWAENMNVEVLINNNMVGTATYGKKKDIAVNRAAKSALDRLKEEHIYSYYTFKQDHSSFLNKLNVCKPLALPWIFVGLLIITVLLLWGSLHAVDYRLNAS